MTSPYARTPRGRNRAAGAGAGAGRSRVARIGARRPDLRFPLPERFGERLAGQDIAGLERRAKYLIATLSSGEDLVMPWA
ncbi:DNA-formamidopyrimidine glycosylase family protein [Bradyrhizobium sp. RDI18]|uniref:DNA-formamidopyrimidine glycosylase family protein n=1 Tax=Bradyrhizobium sp. RDI18 TaxID=3367400 RepID=UPI00371B03E8